MKFLNNSEKANYYRMKKKEVRAQTQQKYYERHRENTNDHGNGTRVEKSRSKHALHMKRSRARNIEQRLRQEEIREKHRQRNREYKQAERQRRSVHVEEDVSSQSTTPFKNRTDKFRAMKKLKESLPQTPKKRVEILKTYIDRSPSGPDVLKRKEMDSLEASVIDNIKKVVESAKRKRSDDARAAMNIVSASVSDENVSLNRCKSKVAKKFGLTRRRIISGKRIRTRILHSDEACFTHTMRKTRSDKLTHTVRTKVYEWWLSPRSSRLTGNKKDVKRVRVGPKIYVTHAIHLLEKTQTEIYEEFCIHHKDISISQRSFEKLKPFFVMPIRPKDRNTCCCRNHVEIRLVFKKCMDYRRAVLNKKNQEETNTFPIYEHISDLANDTLCARDANATHFKLDCLKRNCNHCGVRKFALMPEETVVSETSDDVKWERYEYTNVAVKGNTKRKLLLVKKTTKPGHMFNYLKQMLSEFPAHQYRANWQSAELDALKNELPQGHCMCIHDYSENYRCIEVDELQSSYFQKSEVSIHVSVICRHAIPQYDTTEDDNSIISELFFVISEDLTHDHHFSRHVQQLVANYLRSIGCEIETMHEFTDGCSQQYKSRHCMGAATLVPSDYNYQTFIRNFFETSHGKGPQDAAGGCLKRQLDFAVLHGQTIQSAADVYQFASKNLTTLKGGKYQRRVIRYVDVIPRDENLYFKTISENRKVHQLITTSDSPGMIKLRELSCYSCDECLNGNISQCNNAVHIGPLRTVAMQRESHGQVTHDEEQPNDDMVSLLQKNDIIAVYTADEKCDYYVMKVVNPKQTLKSTFNDDWENTFAAGTDVVRGLYFDKTASLTYKLVPKKIACIYSAAVCYNLTDATLSNNILRLSEQMHLDILSSIC